MFEVNVASEERDSALHHALSGGVLIVSRLPFYLYTVGSVQRVEKSKLFEDAPIALYAG